MPRVSRSRLNQEKLHDFNEHFSHLIAFLTKTDDIEQFFEQFLTHEEKIMLAKRLVLFMMLKQNYSPEIIKAALQVSYETVRTYRNMLESKSPQFHKMIEILLKREKTKLFFEKLTDFLHPLELALNAKSDIRSRAKLLTGDYKNR